MATKLVSRSMLTGFACALVLAVLSESAAHAQFGQTRRRGQRAATARRSVTPRTTRNAGVAPVTGFGTQQLYGNLNIPPYGLNTGTNTIYGVAAGTYIPGFGVNMGFPTPTQVYGGVYLPGYGVNNGFATPTQVHGGTYLPGFGVMGGGTAPAGAVGTQAVRGGTYVPGFGVTGGNLRGR